MPGMGLGLTIAPQLRQDLELEQRLEQRQLLTTSLRLMQTLGTGGNKEYQKQLEILEKIKKDLESGTYSSLEEFNDRVMKRIKKKDRTNGVREIVASLRKITLDLPSLADVGSWVDQGITETKLNGSAHDFYRYSASMGLPYQNLMEFAQDVSKNTRITALGVFEFMHRKREDGYDSEDLLERFVGYAGLHPDRFSDLIVKLRNVLPKNPISTTLERAIELTDELLTFLPPHEGRGEYFYRIYKKGLIDPSLEDKIQEETSLPLAIFYPANEKFRKSVPKLEEYSSKKSFRLSTDAKRNFLNGLHLLDPSRKGGEILEDILEKSKDSKQAGRIFRLLGLQRTLHYPFGLETGSQIVAELQQYSVTKNPLFNGLDAEHRERFVQMIDRSNSRLPIILTTLSEVYEKSYGDGLPLLITLAEKIIDRKFDEWRYSHEKSSEQLEAFDNSERIGEEIVFKGVVGDVSELQSKLRATVPYAQELSEIYSSQYHQEVSGENLFGVKRELDDLIIEATKLSVEDPENKERKKEVGMQIGEKRRQFEFLELIAELSNLGSVDITDVDSKQVESVRTKSYEMARKSRDSEIKERANQVYLVLSSEALQNYRFIKVIESTDPEDLFDVGMKPVHTCQRWNEKTSFNKCLLAYVSDPNKSLFQLKDPYDSVVGRSVVRYLPFMKNTPLVLLERLYATDMSDDLSQLVVGAGAVKALRLSSSLGRGVALGTNDDELIKALEKIAEENERKLKTRSLRLLHLPESMNDYEYSDSLGGSLQSGSSVSTKVHYLTFKARKEEASEGRALIQRKIDMNEPIPIERAATMYRVDAFELLSYVKSGEIPSEDMKIPRYVLEERYGGRRE